MENSEKEIEVKYDKKKGFAVIDDKKENLLIVLEQKHIDALLEKVCMTCSWLLEGIKRS